MMAFSHGGLSSLQQTGRLVVGSGPVWGAERKLAPTLCWALAGD